MLTELSHLKLHDVVSALEYDSGQAIHFTGGQIAVSCSGELVINSAFGYDGTGEAVTSDSVFSIYCATKPLLALLLGMLDERGILSIDISIGSVVPGLRARVAGLKLTDILSQSACLVRPLGIEGILGYAILKNSIVGEIEAGFGYNRPNYTGYSEFAGWYLLQQVVETVCRRPVSSLINEEIIGPLGLQDEIFVDTIHMAPTSSSRIRTNISLGQKSPKAMLIESTQIFRKYAGEGIGGFASARGLCRLYAALGDLALGRESALAITPQSFRKLIASRERAFDILLQRDCSFGLGFMTDLQSHNFGLAISPSAFGHVGLMGMTVAFSDPSRDLSVAWHTNGLVPNDASVGPRRIDLMDRLYEALE